MRLLSAKDLTFKEFLGDTTPEYAIVSHRWGNDEVSYSDFIKDYSSRTNENRGYAWTKIVKACELATLCCLEWVWIDTICINKDSSAELTEAINAMYQWTLQELLATRRVAFFNADFDVIDTRHSLRELTQSASGIPKQYYKPGALSEDCVAERMRWASHRRATRVEDEAYSLLGLFYVNMPPLYGERGRAFRRLLMEIMKNSSDESILAFQLDTHGFVLPYDSRSYTNVGIQLSNYSWLPRKHYEYTNLGVRFNVTIEQAPRKDVTSVGKGNEWHHTSKSVLLFPLNCGASLDSDRHAIARVALLLTIYPRKSDLDLSVLKGVREDEAICVFSVNTKNENGAVGDDIISNLLHGTWMDARTGERVKLDCVASVKSSTIADGYTLYINV